VKRAGTILLVCVLAGCSFYALNPRRSIARANKKYTIFLVNYMRRAGYNYESEAAKLVGLLNAEGFPAFYTHQGINVIVTMGQFNEPRSFEAERMVRNLKARMPLVTVKWASNPDTFKLVDIAILKKSIGVRKADAPVRIYAHENPYPQDARSRAKRAKEAMKK